ncbi:MAG TPA: iron uptake protein [Luteimonas sp.]
MGAFPSAAAGRGTATAADPRAPAAPGTRGSSGARSITRRQAVLLRVSAAILGGYAFAWGIVALATSLCVASGMGFHDAEFLSSLLGVFAYLAAFLWAIAARRLWPAWPVLAGGGALLAGAASAVQAALT